MEGEPTMTTNDPLLADLPFIDPLENPRVLLERLSEPTGNGENVAVHVALDSPIDPSLTDSLVRIIGGEDDPMLAFKTDALGPILELQHVELLLARQDGDAVVEGEISRVAGRGLRI